MHSLQVIDPRKMKYSGESLNLEVLCESNVLTETPNEIIERVRGTGVGDGPQKHVPPEILGKIFLHCLDGEAVSVPPLPSPSMPWTLGHICSRWRKIALEEQKLWENVTFISCKYFPRLAFEEVICRSGESRIINLGHIPSEYFQIILPTLRLHHNRFQYLEIEIIRPTAKLLAEMFLFECLESLSIHYGHALGVSSAGDQLHPEFSAPPSLRRLTLSSDVSNRIPLHSTRISPTAPFWEHLVSFQIENNICAPIFTTLFILEQCKALVECSLLLCNELGSARSDSERITVPSLQSFTVRYIDPVLTDFFASLRLPSLKTLNVIGSLEPWPQNEVLALLDRSGCQLEGFHNEDFMMPVEYVVPLIRAMPCVVRMGLDTDAPIPDSAIDTIIVEGLLLHLEFVTAWFDSSRAALRLVENTWAHTPKPGGGISEGILYIDSSDVNVDEETCRVLKHAIWQSGHDIRISIC